MAVRILILTEDDELLEDIKLVRKYFSENRRNQEASTKLAKEIVDLLELKFETEEPDDV